MIGPGAPGNKKRATRWGRPFDFKILVTPNASE